MGARRTARSAGDSSALTPSGLKRPPRRPTRGMLECQEERLLPARKSFLLRIDPDVLEAVRRWADEDLRSVNGQVEFLLRRVLKEAKRLPKPSKSSPPSPSEESGEEAE